MFTQLDEETVSTYTEALKRGDQFPAVVAHQANQRARLVVIDGNHRITAHRNAGLAVDTYIVSKANPRTLVMMTFAANAKHGLPTSVKERLFQGAYLVDNGASHEQAAAAVNVKVADLRKSLNRINADRRADEVGILRPQWESLHASIKQRAWLTIIDGNRTTTAWMSRQRSLRQHGAMS